jgi:FtsP/CotA-like multicopper oxidase with cupredoxin domain
MLHLTAATVGGITALAGGASARTPEHPGHSPPAATSSPPQMPPAEPGKHYTPVITPNGWTLPYTVRNGVKVFHLIAEPIQHEFAPGLVGECWGYNGTTPGPTIEVVEGDRVRIYVTNSLPEPTSVHWHGILLPNGMDGLAGLTQKPIEPGQTFKYEFTLRQHGTHMYHPHFDEMVQMAMGLQGLFIIHPRNPRRRPDRDFAIMLNEWRIDPGTRRPNPNENLDFNVFTMNSKAFPGTAPLVARLGDRVKIRLANLSAQDHHPIHLHGYQFRITETDGGQIPAAAQQVETTVLVQVGSTRAIEFVTDEPGDWALHCHMTHHVMNQMGHDIPNMIGVEPGNLDDKVRGLLPAYMTMGNTGMGEMGMMPMPVPQNSIPMKGGQGPFGLIDMGGMLTVLKVRQDLASYDDPGWYVHPPGTVADVVSADALQQDGITVPAAATTPGGHHRH